jgi:hypothetical protein
MSSRFYRKAAEQHGAKKTAEGERQQVPWQIVIAYVEELFDDERVGKEDCIDDPGALLRLSLRFVLSDSVL